MSDNRDELKFLAPGVLAEVAAQNDVVEIATYLSRNNRDVALRFYAALSQTLSDLAAMPNIGSPKSFAHPQLQKIRQWPVRDFRDYLIFYRPFASANGLEVLRVLHGSRDVQTHLEGALDEPATPSIGDGE